MPDDLYERDIVVWAQHQAELLRRLAAGERVNEFVDWPNVIEEIEALSRSETRACESYLIEAIAHMLKQIAWPEHSAVGHWREEVWNFLSQAQRAWSPSMRQKLDMDYIFRRAVRELNIASRELGPIRAVPATCALRLDDLLSEEADPDDLVAKLAA